MIVPPYVVVEKRGIKYARLKLSARDGLQVIVPAGFDHDRIPKLLKAKRDWLERHGERLAEQQKFLKPEPPGGLPERLILRAIGEELMVDYRMTGLNSVVGVERPGKRVLVYGDIDNEAAVKDALSRWLARKARLHLTPWLLRLSDEHGLPLHGVMVRSQKTRWASCSKHKRITINVRLLFIPARLVNYVLLHELVHTREMSHSKKFWTLLRSYSPGFDAEDEALRTAWRLVPQWILHGESDQPLQHGCLFVSDCGSPSLSL
ncbi:SprT family zinc-dependent metalloprotease [soil metagenome]